MATGAGGGFACCVSDDERDSTAAAAGDEPIAAMPTSPSSSRSRRPATRNADAGDRPRNVQRRSVGIAPAASRRCRPVEGLRAREQRAMRRRRLLRLIDRADAGDGRRSTAAVGARGARCSLRFSPSASAATSATTPQTNSATAAATRMGKSSPVHRRRRDSRHSSRLSICRRDEQVRRQPDAAVLDAVGALAGGCRCTMKWPGRVPVVVDAGLLEREQVVHLDLVAFHAGDLADADDLAPAAGQAPRPGR